jgi:flagellar hook-associated protein 3 FlgL
MINATGNRMMREITRQSKLADQVDRTQIQISTGKRLQRASDDPVSARRIATIGVTQASMKKLGDQHQRGRSAGVAGRRGVAIGQ